MMSFVWNILPVGVFFLQILSIIACHVPAASYLASVPLTVSEYSIYSLHTTIFTTLSILSCGLSIILAVGYIYNGCQDLFYALCSYTTLTLCYRPWISNITTIDKSYAILLFISTLLDDIYRFTTLIIIGLGQICLGTYFVIIAVFTEINININHSSKEVIMTTNVLQNSLDNIFAESVFFTSICLAIVAIWRTLKFERFTHSIFQQSYAHLKSHVSSNMKNSSYVIYSLDYVESPCIEVGIPPLPMSIENESVLKSSRSLWDSVAKDNVIALPKATEIHSDEEPLRRPSNPNLDDGKNSSVMLSDQIPTPIINSKVKVNKRRKVSGGTESLSFEAVAILLDYHSEDSAWVKTLREKYCKHTFSVIDCYGLIENINADISALQIWYLDRINCSDLPHSSSKSLQEENSSGFVSNLSVVYEESSKQRERKVRVLYILLAINLISAMLFTTSFIIRLVRSDSDMTTLNGYQVSFVSLRRACLVAGYVFASIDRIASSVVLL